MKASHNYIFYPDNAALEQSIAVFRNRFPEQVPEEPQTDNEPVELDNKLRNAQGNLCHHKYSQAMLENAREAFERELTDQFRAQDSLEWAEIQDALGNVLAALGQQLRDATLLEASIQAFEFALEERTQESTPTEWAQTQDHLGAALQALGQLQGSTKLLTRAGDAFINATLVWTREKTPLPWAATMQCLGVAFHAQGMLMKGNRVFQKSVVAYKNAAAQRDDLEEQPIGWAMTHNNRGVVLQSQGEREENPQRLEEAIKAYEKALRVWTEQQIPVHLAVLTKINLASARLALAELTKDAVLAQEVADDFELIIEVFRDNCHADCIEHCTVKRAESLTLLGALNSSL